MPNIVSTPMREAAYAPETGEALLALITIDHPDLAEPIRVTSDGVNTYRRISNTVVDSSAGGNDGTLNGDVAFFPGKLGGSAARFDGLTTHIQIGDVHGFEGTAPFTFEAWIRPVDKDPFTRIVSKETLTTPGPQEGWTVLFFSTDNKLRFRRWVGGSVLSISANEAVKFGLWQHLAATYDGNTMRLYVDGALQSETIVDSRLLIDNAAPLVIGKRSSSSNRYTGDIDDARIWDHARTAQEIADNKDAPLVGNETGLVGYWKLDDGQQYVALPFRVTLPDDTEESARSRLEIDNVDREIVKAIRSISSPPSVTIEIVLGSTPDVVEAGPFDFDLEEANYNVLVVTGELAFEPILDLAVPGDVMSPGLFPGLFV